jgi:hypothetical protein
MPVDFVGREIEVTLSEGEAPVPLTFRMGSRQYKVAEQMASWQDRNVGARQRARDWRQQQQRRYYRVRTEDGEVYELYADWSPARRRKKGQAVGARWYLHRRLISAAAKEAEEESKPAEE